MKKRLISALIALCISLPLIIMGGKPFYVYAIIISLLGMREIVNLMTKSKLIKFITYILYLGIIISNMHKISFTNLIDFRLLAIILLMSAFIMLYNYKDIKFNTNKGFSLLGITIFMAISFSTMIINRNISLYYFIYLFLISCTNDSFAQLIGTQFGEHKINSISPNKSWEGALGGLVFGTLICSLYFYIFISGINPLKTVMITILLSIVGQFGDLFFSLIKRNYGIKDYSNLMPGHGGVLDRLDNMIFVMLASLFVITIL